MADIKKNEKKEVVQREELYKWSSPMRIFQQLDKKKFWMISLAVLALFVVLAILGHYILMIAIASVMFLVYVLGTVPPETVNHVITSLGVESMDKKYNWEILSSYWFSKKDDKRILNIETKFAFPSRLILLVGEADMKSIHPLLKERLVYKDLREQKAMEKLSEGEW
ncbi:MAG: hypothetical protein ABIC57_02105, partial [bacterium]